VSGDVLFANQRFSDMLGVPMSKLFAAPLEAYVAAPDRARLSSFLLVAARNSSIEVRFANDTGTPIVARISLASFSDGYLTLLVTDLGPLNRLAQACDQLSSVREALTALGRSPGLDGATRKSAEAIGADLARLCGSLTSLLDENAAVAAAHTTTESPSTVNR
jgi:FAD/FMN-containing dehydrogenase